MVGRAVKGELADERPDETEAEPSGYRPSPIPRPSEMFADYAELAGALVEAEFSDQRKPLYRVQDSPRVRWAPFSTPRYRFDALSGEYRALYTCDDPAGAIAERYNDLGRRLGVSDAAKHLISFSSEEPMVLLNLRSDTTLSVLGLDARISDIEDWDACQEWGTWLYGAHDGLCGILYRPRKAGEQCSNVVLFGDRCRSLILVGTVGPLGELVDPDDALGGPVRLAAQRYKLSVSFL